MLLKVIECLRSSMVVPDLTKLYAKDCSVVFVPTGVSTETSDLKSLLSDWYDAKKCIVQEKVISRVVNGSQVVEEVVYTLIHEESLNWILPKIKPTNRRLVVPAVFVYKFNGDGKICSQNCYWDQGTVMKQIGILPNSLFCKANNSETVLPVIGIKVADVILRNSNADNLNRVFDGSVEEKDDEKTAVVTAPLTKRDSVASVLAGDLPEDVIRPSTRLFHPPGGISNIFRENSVDDIASAAEVGENRRCTGLGNRSTISFSDEGVDTPLTSGRKLSESSLMKSQFSLDGSFNSELDVVSQKKHNPGSNRSHFALSGEPEVDDKVLPRGKKLSDPKVNTNNSHFTIAFDPVVEGQKLEMEKEICSKKMSLANQFESHFTLNGGEKQIEAQNNAEVTGKGAKRNHNVSSIQIDGRPSSRVLAVPGGKSSFAFSYE